MKAPPIPGAKESLLRLKGMGYEYVAKADTDHDPANFQSDNHYGEIGESTRRDRGLDRQVHAG